ncbi:GGDEF domain-containing protein [Rhodoligotrophos defluvii]|uniref:GGDEF domain-containing protein n=1 Tax=Rhodoligotrophos defluvii TaxID=2561934 RepID=UPI0010C9ADB5|nr:diguanylate cyclase [Rhodoligotrophos defluvii]
MAEYRDRSGDPAGSPPSAFDGAAAAHTSADSSELASRGYLELATMAAGCAAYHWDIRKDILSWSANAAAILGVEPHLLASNRSYASLIARDGATGRYDAVHLSVEPDEGAGVAFQTEYRLRQKAQGSPIVWVEDCGRWFAGLDGRPADVFGVVRVVDQRRRQEERLRYLSAHDSLTGLMNRELVVEKLSAALDRAKISSEPAALLLLSIDNLQAINEAFGTDVADSVIRRIGRLLARVMRAGDHLGRFAGNKLAFVLQHCSADEMRVASERFLDAVRETVIPTPFGPVWATVSIGGVALHAGITTAKQALNTAEHALSRARAQTSGRFFAGDLPQEWPGLHRQNMEQAAVILRALQEDKIVLGCHPIMRPATAAVVMHDIRPHILGSPLPFASPTTDFIGTCRRLGLASLIEVHLVRLALGLLRIDPALTLSVPLSLSTIEMPRARAQILQEIERAAGLAPRLLVDTPLSGIVAATAPARAFLAEVRARKARVALSGFGVDGLPLFRTTDDFPGEFVRVDGTLLREASASTMGRARLNTALEIVRSYGAEIIALDLDPDADVPRIIDYGIDLVRVRPRADRFHPAAPPQSAAVMTPDAAIAPLRKDVVRLRAALAELNSRLALKADLVGGNSERASGSAGALKGSSP